MITQEQWEEDRNYISRLRYGIDKYNHLYANKIPYLKKTYGDNWQKIPWSTDLENLGSYV